MDENTLVTEDGFESEIPIVPEEGTFGYEYPIIDQNNQEVIDPDLTLGYLRKENFTVHHETVPEKWHYKVAFFNFTDGEKYIPTSESDPHIEVIDAQKGIFKYINLDGEEERIVSGQTITAVIDQKEISAYNEEQTFYRYVLYTEKELADRDFLTNGPQLLAEAQETIDDLLLILAELLGGEDTEEPIEE